MMTVEEECNDGRGPSRSGNYDDGRGSIGLLQDKARVNQYSYRDRCNKKCERRGLWIERINAGSLQHKEAGIEEVRVACFFIGSPGNKMAEVVVKEELDGGGGGCKRI